MCSNNPFEFVGARPTRKAMRLCSLLALRWASMTRTSALVGMSAALSLSVLGCGVPGSDKAKGGNQLTEVQLLEYASAPFEKELDQRPVQLGSLDGAPVVVEYVCSDVCPNYTVRIIHFSLPQNVSCASVDGVMKSMDVPVGIGSEPQEFCFPKVLASN